MRDYTEDEQGRIARVDFDFYTFFTPNSRARFRTITV